LVTATINQTVPLTAANRNISGM